MKAPAQGGLLCTDGSNTIVKNNDDQDDNVDEIVSYIETPSWNVIPFVSLDIRCYSHDATSTSNFSCSTSNTENNLYSKNKRTTTCNDEDKAVRGPVFDQGVDVTIDETNNANKNSSCDDTIEVSSSSSYSSNQESDIESMQMIPFISLFHQSHIDTKQTNDIKTQNYTKRCCSSSSTTQSQSTIAELKGKNRKNMQQQRLMTTIPSHIRFPTINVVATKDKQMNRRRPRTSECFNDSSNCDDQYNTPPPYIYIQEQISKPNCNDDDPVLVSTQEIYDATEILSYNFIDSEWNAGDPRIFSMNSSERESSLSPNSFFLLSDDVQTATKSFASLLLRYYDCYASVKNMFTSASSTVHDVSTRKTLTPTSYQETMIRQILNQICEHIQRHPILCQIRFVLPIKIGEPNFNTNASSNCIKCYPITFFICFYVPVQPLVTSTSSLSIVDKVIKLIYYNFPEVIGMNHSITFEPVFPMKRIIQEKLENTLSQPKPLEHKPLLLPSFVSLMDYVNEHRSYLSNELYDFFALYDEEIQEQRYRQEQH